MRGIFVLAITMLLAASALAADSTEIALRPYVGIFGIGEYNDHLNFSPSFADFWVGAEATVPGIGSYGTLMFRGVYKTSDAPIFQVWLDCPIGSASVLAGFMSRPISIQRPNPVSDGAQFMPPSKAVIPGAASGVAMRNGDLSSSWKMVGVYYLPDARTAELDAGFKEKFSELASVEGALFYSRGRYGVAATVSEAWLSGMIYAESDSLQSLFVKVVTKSAGEPYLTLVHNRELLTNSWEVGWTKVVAIPGTPIQMLYGVGYSVTNKLGRFYLQAFL